MAVIDIEYGRAILEGNSEGNSKDSKRQGTLELEMVLQNSSFGHEYARMELEQTQDFLLQEELIRKMESCKRAYFFARRYLKKQNPLRLEAIETDLMDQKVRIFGTYNA